MYRAQVQSSEDADLPGERQALGVRDQSSGDRLARERRPLGAPVQSSGDADLPGREMDTESFVRRRKLACVCMCMRVYACVCVCMRVYACVCVCMRMYECVCVCMRVYACVCVCMCDCVCK